jgi:hypothetical protein
MGPVGLGVTLQRAPEFIRPRIVAELAGGLHPVGETEKFHIAPPFVFRHPGVQRGPVGGPAQGFRGDYDDGRLFGDVRRQSLQPADGLGAAPDLVQPADQLGGLAGRGRPGLFEDDQDGGEMRLIGAGNGEQAVGNVGQRAAGMRSQGFRPLQHRRAVVVIHGIAEQRTQGRRAPFAIGRPFGEQPEAALARNGIAGVDQDRAQGHLVDGDRAVEMERRLEVGLGQGEENPAARDFPGDPLGE